MHGSAQTPDAPWLRRSAGEPAQRTRTGQTPTGEQDCVSRGELDYDSLECDGEDTFDEFVSRVGMPTLAGSVSLLILLIVAAVVAVAMRLATGS